MCIKVPRILGYNPKVKVDEESEAPISSTEASSCLVGEIVTIELPIYTSKVRTIDLIHILHLLRIYCQTEYPWVPHLGI